MRTSLALLTLVPLLSSAPLAEAADEVKGGPGTLVLSDGAVLHGEPESIADGMLKWRSGTLVDAVSVAQTSVVEMHLPGVSPAKQEGRRHVLINLSNGDKLSGELMTVTDTEVTIKTSYGGTLTLKRTMVGEMEVLPNGMLYSGPSSPRDWVEIDDQDVWRFDTNALRSTKGAVLVREFDAPDQCRFSFDLGWRNSLRFRLLLFSDDGKSANPDNCYDLVVQRRFVYLRKRWMSPKSGGSKILGQASIASLGEKTSARFDFYLDRKAGTLLLYLDGVEEAKWTDVEHGVGALGKWVHFISEDFYPLEVSRIRLSKWNGKPPAKAVRAAPIAKGEGQKFELQDGTSVVGRLQGFDNGVLHLKSEPGDRKVPLEQISKIDLSAEKYEEPIRKRGDIRVWTVDGDRITFRLDSFGKKTLKGYNQIYGDVELKRDEFTRFDFNIYDQKLDSVRGLFPK